MLHRLAKFHKINHVFVVCEQIQRTLQHKMNNYAKQMRFNFHLHIHSLVTSFGSSSKKTGGNPPVNARSPEFQVTVDSETYALIGEGGYGIVLALRDIKTKQSLRRILKISPFIDVKLRYDSGQADAFYKEVLFSRALKTVMVPPIKGSTNTTPHCIVPKLYSYRVSQNTTCSYGCQVMQQLDGTMRQLGLSQAEKFGITDGSFAFTTFQFRKMGQLLKILKSILYVHGDFKLGNIVETDNGQIMMVIDHAFGGWAWYYLPELMPSEYKSKSADVKANPFYRPQIGYPDLPFADKANQLNPKNPPNFPKHLWQYLNQCQLYFSLNVTRHTYLIEDDNKTCKLIPSEVILMFLELPQEHCLEFQALYNKQKLKQRK
jgi:hypothetical protein